MKRLFQVLAITALISCLTSCGLPMAVVRSVGRAANAAGGLLGPAAAAAAL